MSSTSEIDFARKPDRAMVLGITGLGVYLLGCGCGMVMGILAMPIWLVAGGLGGYGYYLGKQAMAEIDEGQWDTELRSKASQGITFGAVAAGLGGGTTLLLGLLLCAGILLWVVMMALAAASGSL